VETIIPNPFIIILEIYREKIITGNINQLITIYDLTTKEEIGKLNFVKNEDFDVLNISTGLNVMVPCENWLICGTDKSLDIWDMNQLDQFHPAGRKKTKGKVLHITQDKTQKNVFYVYMKQDPSDEYKFIKWKSDIKITTKNTKSESGNPTPTIQVRHPVDEKGKASSSAPVPSVGRGSRNF